MSTKTTFIIRDDIIMQVKEAVKSGFSKSMSSFVEQALNSELEKIKKENIKKEILKASKDPLFLADVHNTREDFSYSDFE